MSELRQDVTTREWVIISTERARRPHEFSPAQAGQEPAALPEYSETCPFCLGNEALTPGELFALREEGKRDDPSWQVRVIPNKFPALRGESEPTRLHEGMFRGVNGFGYHEVVIETPLHNREMALMEVSEVKKVVGVFHARYEAMRSDPRVKLIVIFKNHGRTAGTSLEHPHSQIVAVPIIPGGVRARIEVAQRHHDDNGECVYCSLLEEELRARKRIVLEAEGFVAFHPFASRVPFETWIMPRTHNTSFGDLQKNECRAVASVLKSILAKLHQGLQNPDFNLILQSAPVEDEDTPYYHWHIQIFPRLTLQAGFELGSGIYINSALPEETAAFLREIPEPAPAK